MENCDSKRDLQKSSSENSTKIDIKHDSTTCKSEDITVVKLKELEVKDANDTDNSKTDATDDDSTPADNDLYSDEKSTDLDNNDEIKNRI